MHELALYLTVLDVAGGATLLALLEAHVTGSGALETSSTAAFTWTWLPDVERR